MTARSLAPDQPPDIMRSVPFTILVSLLLGLLAFSGVYWWRIWQIDEQHAHLTAIEWFCREFEIDSSQREKIEALHAAYFPECEDHCIHYADTRETLAIITGDPKLDQSPAHVEALRRLSELEREADKEFIDFIYRVAGEMDPAASRRYLLRMKGWLDCGASPAPTDHPAPPIHGQRS